MNPDALIVDKTKDLIEKYKGKTLSEIAKESGFTVTHTYTKEFIKSDKKDKKDDNHTSPPN
nr:MAG TPA: helix-turn-helix domain protein [Caudoviricetes sp.]